MGICETDKFHAQANKSAKECKKIIAISNNNKEKLNEIYSQYRDKIITIPNGYNPDVFYQENCSKEELLKSFNIDEKYDKIVCFAGRLTKNKGVDILLNSAKIYGRDNVLTLIAGYGGEYEALNHLKKKLELENVAFVGDQSHATLRKIYSISDVCIVPSREEAFGLVALEAIACGTPVIATKQGGMVDFITNDVGILVEKENVQQLATEIQKVLSQEIEFDKTYLQNYAKNNYSQEILMDKLLEIYEEVRKD
ncbi:MAG: glycosyltransferase family 4 protein [Clostridia bacterium]|nr:glycosyltransferase family 4 protein [Clostridia bacterium]